LNWIVASHYKVINLDPTIPEQFIQLYLLCEELCSNEFIGAENRFILNDFIALFICSDIANYDTTRKNSHQTLNSTLNSRGGSRKNYLNGNLEDLNAYLKNEKFVSEQQQEVERRNFISVRQTITNILEHLKRNKKYYYLFLISTSILIIFRLGVYLIYSKGENLKVVIEELRLLAEEIDYYLKDFPGYINRMLSSFFDIFDTTKSCKKSEAFIKLKNELRKTKKDLTNASSQIKLLQKAKQTLLEELESL
jgi:hypothetical protein